FDKCHRMFSGFFSVTISFTSVFSSSRTAVSISVSSSTTSTAAFLMFMSVSNFLVAVFITNTAWYLLQVYHKYKVVAINFLGKKSLSGSVSKADSLCPITNVFVEYYGNNML